jgi:hypothetical protein
MFARFTLTLIVEIVGEEEPLAAILLINRSIQPPDVGVGANVNDGLDANKASIAAS